MSPGGWGKGKPQATSPHPTAGTRLSGRRSGGASAGALDPCHPSWSLRDPESRAPTSLVSASGPERPRSTGFRVQATGPQISRCPAPPPGGARGPGLQPRVTLEGELLAPRFEEFSLPGRRFRPEVPRYPSPRLPGLEELGLRTASAPTSLFWAETPLLQGDPGSWDSPALPPEVV